MKHAVWAGIVAALLWLNWYQNTVIVQQQAVIRSFLGGK